MKKRIPLWLILVTNLAPTLVAVNAAAGLLLQTGANTAFNRLLIFNIFMYPVSAMICGIAALIVDIRWIKQGKTAGKILLLAGNCLRFVLCFVVTALALGLISGYHSV